MTPPSPLGGSANDDRPAPPLPRRNTLRSRRRGQRRHADQQILAEPLIGILQAKLRPHFRRAQLQAQLNGVRMNFGEGRTVRPVHKLACRHHRQVDVGMGGHQREGRQAKHLARQICRSGFAARPKHRGAQSRCHSCRRRWSSRRRRPSPLACSQAWHPSCRCRSRSQNVPQRSSSHREPPLETPGDCRRLIIARRGRDSTSWLSCGINSIPAGPTGRKMLVL